MRRADDDEVEKTTTRWRGRWNNARQDGPPPMGRAQADAGRMIPSRFFASFALFLLYR